MDKADREFYERGCRMPLKVAEWAKRTGLTQLVGFNAFHGGTLIIDPGNGEEIPAKDQTISMYMYTNDDLKGVPFNAYVRGREVIDEMTDSELALFLLGNLIAQWSAERWAKGE